MKKLNVILSILTVSIVGLFAVSFYSANAVEIQNPTTTCEQGHPNFIDTNNDGVCDNFIDANNDGVCDNHANMQGKGRGHGKGMHSGNGTFTHSANFVDANNDGVCDNHANMQGKGRGHGKGMHSGNDTCTHSANFVDTNNDGVCDNNANMQGNGRRHGKGMHSGNGTCTHSGDFTDTNNDGVCDNHANMQGKGRRTGNNSSPAIENLSVYPNPANNANSVKFTLKEKANVKIGIYDLKGNLVKSIYTGEIEAGNQTIEYNTEDINNGSYLLKIDANRKSASQQLVVEKK